MKNLLLLFISCFLLLQGSDVIAQTQGTVKVESYFNMDTTLGVIFCGKLNHLVYDAALQGKIPVYKTSDLKLEEKLVNEQIIMQGANEEIIQIADPYSRYERIIDTVIKSPLTIDKVTGYYFSIKWELASDGFAYFGIPDAFSLAYNSSSNKDSANMQPLFWFLFTDLKKILDSTEYHQLQVALFLHIYPHFDLSSYELFYKSKKANEASDIKTNSTKKYFFNTRLYTDLDSKEWLEKNIKLFKDAIKAKVLVYRNDSMSFGSIKTPEEILGFNRGCAIPIENPDMPKDTIKYKPFEPLDIVGNSVSEQWYMDYTNNKIIGQITGISLDYNSGYTGYHYGKQPSFYVPFKYVKSVIGKSELLRMSIILFNSLVYNYLK